MTTEQHDPTECDDPTCTPCLTACRLESIVRLELAIMQAELGEPDGAWIDGTLTVDALDVRNVLDLARSL